MLWAVLSFPSRAAGRLVTGDWVTLCFAALQPDAPLWVRILAALAEYAHPGHAAWTTDIPNLNE